MAKLNFEGSGAQTSTGWTDEQWRDWCWERNQQAIGRGWSRWHYVRSVDTGNGKSWRVEILTGAEAHEIWAMMDDRPFVPFRWPEDRIRKSLRIAEWRMQQGMTPDVYLVWSSEGRRQRRAAWVEREIGASVAQPEAQHD